MGDVRRALTAALAIVALAAALSLAPCAGAGAGAGSAPRVTLIGDSVAAGVLWNENALTILREGIELDMRVSVCRRLTGRSCPYEGARAPTLVDLVAELGPQLGPTVVVVVGHNDFERTFASSVAESVDALLDAGVTRILWATLRAARRPYVPMNAELWAAAATRPELTIVDWNRYSRSHPNWFQNDGLHLTRAGGIALATLLHTALARRSEAPAIMLPEAGLRPALAGRSYEIRLVARGGTGPYAWALVWGNPPAGLRLAPDGRLYGRPRRAGRFPVVLRVEDADGAVSLRRVALVVKRAG